MRIKGEPVFGMPKRKRAKKVKRRGRYWAGETLNFEWQEADVLEFIQAYNDLRAEGLPGPEVVADLSKLFKRPDAEVAILIIDLGERGFLRPDGKPTINKFSVDC